MNTTKSLQEAREALAANSGALLRADADFFNAVGTRFDALKTKSSHPADFRRLSADVRKWTHDFTGKDSWNAANDAPVYDGAMAWIDIIDREIENRVVMSEVIPAEPKHAGGWRNATTGEAIKLYNPDERIGGSTAVYGEQANVGIGELLQGMMLGTQSAAVRNALEAGTDSAGGYTVPLHITRQFIDQLRAKSVFVAAGARTMTLDGKTRIVRLDQDPTAVWRAENASIGDSNIVLSAIELTPHSLSTLVKVPYELLQDSVNVADILSTALLAALSLELDRAALFGSGTSNQPTGLFNAANVNSVSMGTNGAVPTSYDNLLDMVYELELDNAGEPTAAIWHPRTARTHRKLKDSTGQPLVAPDPVKDLPKLATTSVPIDQTQGTSTGVCSTVLIGDFTEAILGVREELQIIRLNETFAANGQVGFWARMRADVGFAHGQSFCKLIGVKM